MHFRERGGQRAEIGDSKSADHRKQVALEPRGQRWSEQARTKRTEKPMMSTPWAPLAADSEPKQRPQKTKERRQRRRAQEQATASRWYIPHGTRVPWPELPAGTATPVTNMTTGAAAAAATARPGATTAQISLAPSTDLPRRERDGTPNTRTTTLHTPTTYEIPSATVSIETEPITPGQDNDPDRIFIDDVV